MQVRNRNGSSSTNYIALTTTLPAPTSGIAVFDSVDHTFVVQKGSGYNESAQMQAIIDALAYIRSLKKETGMETYNVKYAVNSPMGSITLPPIKVSPTFASSYAGYSEGIQLNVIPVHNISSSIATREIILYNTGSSSISLPADNNRYHIFNVDFDGMARYTMQEVIQGITKLTSQLDPYISLYGDTNNLTYPEYAQGHLAVVPNSNVNTFQDCIFTSLVRTLILENLTTPGAHDLAVGESMRFKASRKVEVGNSFTSGDLLGEAINQNTSNDSRPYVQWFSSDPSVATVDADGVVTAQSAGAVTIIAKAIDALNAGEIEKPWAVYQLEITLQPTPTLIGASTLPQTGDSSNIILWIIAWGFTAVALVLVMAKEWRKSAVQKTQ